MQITHEPLSTVAAATPQIKPPVFRARVRRPLNFLSVDATTTERELLSTKATWQFSLTEHRETSQSLSQSATWFAIFDTIKLNRSSLLKRDRRIWHVRLRSLAGVDWIAVELKLCEDTEERLAALTKTQRYCTDQKQRTAWLIFWRFNNANDPPIHPHSCRSQKHAAKKQRFPVYGKEGKIARLLLFNINTVARTVTYVAEQSLRRLTKHFFRRNLHLPSWRCGERPRRKEALNKETDSLQNSTRNNSPSADAGTGTATVMWVYLQKLIDWRCGNEQKSAQRGTEHIAETSCGVTEHIRPQNQWQATQWPCLVKLLQLSAPRRSCAVQHRKETQPAALQDKTVEPVSRSSELPRD